VEGLAKLEERVFSGGSNPVIVFEPTGLAWLLVALYLEGRHPDSRLVRVQAQKVVALRKYLHRSSKSDKIDFLTLVTPLSFRPVPRLSQLIKLLIVPVVWTQEGPYSPDETLLV